MDMSMNNGWHEHTAQLVLFVRQWTRSQADAEDVVQQAFLQFWQARDRVGDAKAYLYTCVRTAAFDWMRAQRRRDLRDQGAALQAARQIDPLFTAAPEEEEFRRHVETLLETLPPEQRQVLVMKIWGELTFAQIAQVLETSPNTIASRYRYALEALRQKMPKEEL